MKKILTGVPDFEAIISSGDTVYVDKTSFICRMLDTGERFFFISRPRRFGKSLMCSTLDALFSGKKDLFNGLYIGKSDYDFRAFPVLRFDFSKLKATTYESFVDNFRFLIQEAGGRNGIEVESRDISLSWQTVLSRLVSPVIIIDEFDAPVIDAIAEGDHELAEQMRRVFNSFYSIIKSYTDRIKFLFITGCTKLSGLSIFSAMNSLDDISQDPEYASMFGYTEEELEGNFPEHIGQKLALPGSTYKSKEEFLSALRFYYDGYRFSPESGLTVYNPVSIGKYFSKGTLSFNNFWMNTGGLSTLAVTLARHNSLLDLVEERAEANVQDLAVFDVTTLSAETLSRRAALALLYYAGYLTIVGADGTDIYLSFPNEEVRGTFLPALIETYGNYDRNPASIANAARKAAAGGDVWNLVRALNDLYRPLTPMGLRGNKENLVQLLFKALFVISGIRVMTEVYAGKGRLDALVMVKGHNYIIEFKVDGKSAEDAMRQIAEKHYGWLLAGDSTPLHLVGLDFRTEERQVVSYTHQIYGSGEIESRDVPLVP